MLIIVFVENILPIKNGDFMSNKKHKKQVAIKKAKQRKRIILIIGIAILLAILALFVFALVQRGQQRVFAEGRQQVTLNDNGAFTSRDAHGRTRSGTFTETSSDGVITISFTEGGTTVTGTIENNVLTKPPEWDDGCGHNPRLTLIRGREQ